MKFIRLTRNEPRFFKHICGMTDDKPKRPAKISIYIPAAKREAFHERAALSQMSMSEFVMKSVFREGKLDPAMQKIGAKLLAEAALIKSEIQSQGLMSEEIADELKLIRTALMQMMGRRS